MITREQFKEYGVNVRDEILANAALEWISTNTTLTVDLNDATTLGNLPYTAIAFIAKFEKVMSASSTVQSQSIDGLSQTFKTGDKSDMIWDLANTLLSGYLKGQIRFVTAKRRWY